MTRLADLTWEEIRARATGDPVVVLPTGSIEQHGPHLPVKVDTLLVTSVCEEAVRRASDRVEVLLAPTVWMGLSTHHTAYFSLTLSIDTYQHVITELVEQPVRNTVLFFRRQRRKLGDGSIQCSSHEMSIPNRGKAAQQAFAAVGGGCHHEPPRLKRRR